MIACDTVEKRSIRGHYDLSTLFYRLLWGPHIHHGLWNGDESPRQAQVQLTETLADLAEIAGGERLLDVGCGMGGSSIHLAKRRGCRATGITVSRVQRLWAGASATLQGVGRQADFRIADAETVEFPEEFFDVVWSIECTEHFFDKPRFFQRAARWVKPGGRVAICAWLAGDPPLDASQEKKTYDVCEGFLCPSLGTMEDYRNWMTSAGLTVQSSLDWTSRVLRTWEICRDRVRSSGVRGLARLLDRETVRFIDRFETILDAYRSGAMKYGALVAVRPLATSAGAPTLSEPAATA